MSMGDVIVDAGKIAAALMTLGTLIGLLGHFVWKRIAKPWLENELIRPVQEAHEQVTNSHKTNLRDDITALQTSVTSLATSVDDLRTYVAAHVDHAAEMDRRHYVLAEIVKGLQKP